MLSLASRLVASLIFDVFFFFCGCVSFCSLFPFFVRASFRLLFALCPRYGGFGGGVRPKQQQQQKQQPWWCMKQHPPPLPACLPACKFHPLCTPFCPVPPPPLRCPLSHPPLSWWTECPVARGNPNAVPALIASIHFFFFFFVVAFL